MDEPSFHLPRNVRGGVETPGGGLHRDWSRSVTDTWLLIGHRSIPYAIILPSHFP